MGGQQGLIYIGTILVRLVRVEFYEYEEDALMSCELHDFRFATGSIVDACKQMALVQGVC